MGTMKCANQTTLYKYIKQLVISYNSLNNNMTSISNINKKKYVHTLSEKDCVVGRSQPLTGDIETILLFEIYNRYYII